MAIVAEAAEGAMKKRSFKTAHQLFRRRTVAAALRSGDSRIAIHHFS
jgi:hypothetical protein